MSIIKRKMTKAEMAATPHEIQNGFAILKDGSHWIWDDRFLHWALWKK